MLRRIKHAPTEADFTEAELKRLRKLRSDENNGLLSCCRGESETLPDHTHINLPGTTCHDWTEPNQAEADFDLVVKKQIDQFKHLESTARRELAKKGIRVPDGLPTLEWLEKTQPQARALLAQVTAAAASYEDLFNLPETRTCIALAQVLQGFNLKLSDLAEAATIDELFSR